MLQYFTFRNFPDFFVGGAERRSFILGLAARGAARQKEVRYPLRFFVFALPIKRILLDFDLCYTESVANESKDFFNRRLGQFEVLRVGYTKAAI